MLGFCQESIEISFEILDFRLTFPQIFFSEITPMIFPGIFARIASAIPRRVSLKFLHLHRSLQGFVELLLSMLFQEFLKNFSNYSTDCLKCLQSSPRAFPGVPSRIPSWIFPGISLGTSPGIPSEIVTCISLGFVQRISSGIAQAFLEAFSFNNSGISLNIYRDCFRNALRVSSQIPVFSSLVSIDSSGSTSELSLQAFLCFLRKPVQSLILHSRLGF